MCCFDGALDAIHVLLIACHNDTDMVWQLHLYIEKTVCLCHTVDYRISLSVKNFEYILQTMAELCLALHGCKEALQLLQEREEDREVCMQCRTSRRDSL